MANSSSTGPVGIESVQRLVTGARGAYPDAATLRACALSGWAFATIPDHPERHLLRADFALFSARHLAVRQAVADLVAAWRAAGVDALVFKGFYMAEFAYEAPGARSYHDVDLVVRADTAEAACRCASSIGWKVVWRLGEPDRPGAARAPSYDGHELLKLHHPQLSVDVDVHRRMAHNNHNRLPFHRAQKRLTERVWSASVPVAWHGTEIRTIHPLDAVIVGLAVNRCWGSDAWHLKPRDYLDAATLVARFGLTAEALHERARELGVARTFGLFLERCDPLRGHFDLRPAAWVQQRRWNLAIAHERGWIDLEQGLVHARGSAAGIQRGALAFARAWTTVRRVANGGPTHVANGRKATGTDRTLSYQAWRDLRRAVHRCMRVLGVPKERRAEVAVRSAHALLVDRGYDATLAPGGPDPVLMVDGSPLDLFAAFSEEA